MGTQHKLSTVPVLILLFITVVWNISLYFLPAQDTVWNYLFNICYASLYLYSMVVGIIGVQKLGYGSSIGKALLFLGLGAGSYAIASYIWVYYNIALNVEIPFPSLADVFYLMLAPLLAVGCWNLLSTLRSQITTQHIIESFAIFIFAAIGIFGFVYNLELASSAPLLNNLINIFYPLSDVILIALAFIVWRVGGGKIQQVTTILVLALILQMVADALFTYQTTTETYWNGSSADTAWAFSGFFFALVLVYLYNNFVNVQTQPTAPSIPPVQPPTPQVPPVQSTAPTPTTEKVA